MASDEENANVVSALAADYPGAVDWNVKSEVVEILDAKDQVIGVIDLDRLDRYWG